MAYVRDTAVAVPTNEFSFIPVIRNAQIKNYRESLSSFSNASNAAVAAKAAAANAAQAGSSAKSSKTTSYGYYASPSVTSAPSVDYLDADLAKHYGMDAATAYQEALANTAIRRQMADLKAAGLNPVLAANYGGSSSSVYNPTLQQEASYGNSGMYSGGSGSYRSSAKSGNAVLNNRNVQMALASIGSAATMAATKNFSLGAAAYYGIQAGFQLLK